MENALIIHPREMVSLVTNGRPREAIRLARSLRKEGVRGALWIELVAAVADRTSEGIGYAEKLAKECTYRDLYRESPVPLPLDARLAVELASWILHHEWTEERMFNPGRRLQQLLSVHETVAGGRVGDAGPVAAGLEAEAAVRKGRLVSALSILARVDSESAADSFFRRAAVALFRAVPKENVQDAIIYRGGQVRSFGLATIEGAGHLFAEYTGAQIRKAQLFRETAAPLPEVRVLLDTGETPEEVFSACLRRRHCPEATNRRSSLRDRRNAS